MRPRNTILGILAVACAALVPASASAAQYGWSSDRDSVTGYRYTVPGAIFDPIEGDGRPAFNYFVSDDGRAKLMYGAWDKEVDATPESLKRWMIENAGGEQNLTYEPKGKSWFVVSGYKGDLIYYEKVMFSCGNRLVSIFAIAYPKSDRGRYDPAVERMEDVFRPGYDCR
ncbi:hypothetical protein A7A08_00688 [Methyloligella halotolerans]|uniref:Uncharacterized protein n=1 Tax=Methyloligella halotolerans TaxID=1177755 RepID=A0A1E2S339_9HYPH|nr:hypothetical protein [Methyloligella halotolerans]ODA68854.1 hypothetical protein A7A08_00688 [Methyloligella halotolerans]